MAASSGGVEWSALIKTFLSSEFGKGNKADVIELCSTIIKNESEILRYKDSNKSFYNSFVVLAVSLIISNARRLTVSQLEVVNAACRVLLKYLLSTLQSVSREGNPNSSQAEQFLKAIKALCLGTEFLSSDEVSVLTDTMKGDTVTGHTPSGADKEISNKQDSSKSRTDLSVSIFEQLTMPLRDGHTVTSEASSSQANVNEPVANSDPTTEINKLFLVANTESLQALRAGDTLADLCLSLPAIKRARTKVEEALAGKPFSLPTTHSEASIIRSSLPSNMADISLASSAINLPVLEPLTPSKLDKLCSLSMAVLQCAISHAAANAMLSLGPAVSPKCTCAQTQAVKDDDLDANAIALVEEALNIFTFVGNTIKNSTRAGGHVYQNHLLAGAWVLISGLQSHLTNSMSVGSEKGAHGKERDEKGRSPSKTRETGSSRSSLIKFQQSFGVLSVALASKAISLLSELFEDLYLEVCGGGGNTLQVEPAPLAIMGQFTALQRVARLLGAAPLNQLLFYLATVSYRKACTLKRIHPPEGDTYSQSDSTTYYEDMIMCSDESSTEDDDSEPILGQWFEATIAPPENSEPAKQQTTSENQDNKTAGTSSHGGGERNHHSIVPEKGEAHGYISLSTQIFVFINRHLLCSKSAYVTRYVKGGLCEQQMVILAAIIRDLDKETARTEVGTISVYFGAALGQLYCEFSGALTRFTHNLITHPGLQHLQTSLLTHLGISPWNSDVPHSWPLQVYSRSLAVLAQVLLLRPQNEKEASVISIWHRVVNTLIENVINPPPMLDTDNEDINVEHAQVLLYLFHSLNLMQKKSVVLLMAGGVLRCSEVACGPLRDFQLLHLSRLLLLFDYIMKHLYDAPAILLEQIQWNLFYSTNLNTDKDKENNMSRMFTPWKEIEDNYRKLAGADEFSMKPCFYMLTNVEISNQDAPKLDGLACNFVLGTPDKLRYPLLLDALIEILNVTHITSGSGASKMTFLGVCATQYCFSICWRLLQLLPPSTANMERLSTGETFTAGPLLLHSLIWGARAGHKNFNRWLKDALVKQGMYTVVAEKLLKAVSDTVNTLKYDVTTAKNCIIALTPDVKKGAVSKESLPPLWHLFILDSVLAKVQISLIDEAETNTADASGVTISGATYVQELLPHVLRLTQAILHCTRWALLHSMVQQSEPAGKYTIQDFESLQEVLAIASSQNTLTYFLATELSSLLPPTAINVLQQWSVSTLEECSWTPYLNDVIPSESYILKIIDIHTSTLSMSYPFNVNYSLKRLLQCLVKFICQHAPKIENTDTKNKAIELLVLVTLDIRTEFLHETVSKTLDKMIGDTETDEHQKRVYLHFLEHSYKLITRCTQQQQHETMSNKAVVDEKVLHSCLKFYEKLLEKSSGRQALETFFSGDRDLVKVLMSVSSPQISQQYSTKVLNFFNKLFQAAEKSSTDPSLNYLCSSMCKLAEVETEKLHVWLRHVILGPTNMEASTSSSIAQTATLAPNLPPSSTSSSKLPPGKSPDIPKPPPMASSSSAVPATTTTTAAATSSSSATTNNPESGTSAGAPPSPPPPTSGGRGAQWASSSSAPVPNTELNVSPTPSDDQKSLVQENSQLLQALTSFIVKQSNNMSEEVALTILKALLPLGSYIVSPALEGVGFTDLMVVMTMLADAGSGKGHIHLFPATAEWLETCGQFFASKDATTTTTAAAAEKNGEGTTQPPDTEENNNNGGLSGKNAVMLGAACCLMDYVGDVVAGLASQAQGQSSATATAANRPLSPPWENEMPLDVDAEWPDETNDDEDSGDDSDEDSLSNKLCTFTITQKEFMNQHWYHCHTCRMLDGVGVCSVCARVCHKGHDLSYAKYGNFFCDCGAKEDGSCQALVKRSPQSNEPGPPSSTMDYAAAVASGATTTTAGEQQQLRPSSLRRRTSSPIPPSSSSSLIVDKSSMFQGWKSKGGANNSSSSSNNNNNNSVAKQIDGSRDWLYNYLNGGGCSIPKVLLDLAESLIPEVEKTCARSSAVGCHARALKAVKRLHSAEKKYVHTDQLMVPTLGSQEGAFENVRMSYSGEQGQTIRQLLSAHIIRRVAMCCMSSIHGRRQHLAVSHEKGKITVLQLSALLKQADSSTRKLTLTRLASAPIPFTVLSLSSNQCNEDYLAVCGLKDCHVLTFTSTGSVSDHLVLHPQLETGNFIIKAIWLPGSQTKLALVTADFVKIYDLAKDALSPQYYFLVPSGKIRDCTFIYYKGVYNILIMSSPGHIYIELLNEESSAKHGSFYVTNTLEVFHLDTTDVNGQVAGGGVSIYYSHTLGLLFYSYAQGKSFISPIKPKSNCLSVVFPINLTSQGSSNSKSNGNKNPTPQPLCQWTEIPNHPGLICSVMQSSNNPVIIMLKPDTVAIQEIKVVPSKSKIMDMVAIRHVSGNEQRTTLILLCEDGSLKIYMANMEQTDFWMSSNIQPALSLSSSKPRKKKVAKPGGKSSGCVTFPVDFFEHCLPMNDVEVGGNDLLQVYNIAQLKHRLNATGLYVVCTKPIGFTVEITNPDNNMVMTGVRVAVGSQDPQRAPSFIEVFGRIITISCTRSRWYDVPFSREESLQADKKLSVTFGPSQDPETVTMVDSIKVYGKTKEAFGWPEENEETVANNATATQSVTVSSNNVSEQLKTPLPLSNLERLVVGILEILDNSFALCSTDGKMSVHKQASIKVTTTLLTLPSSPSLQIHSKTLLSTLHSTKQAYHNYKDQALLQHVLSSLSQMTETDPKNYADIDPESFYRLVMIVRGIAVSRPQNLVKFCDSQGITHDLVSFFSTLIELLAAPAKISKNQHLLLKLMDVLWILHSQRVDNPSLAPLICPGLKHVEHTVHAIVEILHSFHISEIHGNVAYAYAVIAVYLQLLLCEDQVIAFSAKQALSKVLKPKTRRRKVFIPSPPHCATPSTKTSVESEKEKPPRASTQSSQEEETQSRTLRYDVDSVESIGLLQQGGSHDNQNVNPLEALLGGGAGFAPLLDIPPDADDETMVELAIALSLQEHELGGEIQQAQQELRTLQVSGGGSHAQETGHYSDTTVSAAGSDDEGSTAATDGSTLRTSPAEQGGSAGSESGGSGVESITGEHNASGRSSAYGDNIQEAANLISRSDTSSLTNANCHQNPETYPIPQEAEHEPEPEPEPEADPESCSRLHVLRLQLLEKLIEYLPKLHNFGGVRVIPFLQVVLQLTTELDSHMERDKACLNSLLTAIVNELQMNDPNLENVSERTERREVQMVLMRLLSVLMSRCKTTTSSSAPGVSTKSTSSDNSTFVSQTTATVLYKADVVNYCLKLLQALLEYWRSASADDEPPQIGGNLLKEHLTHAPPDMTPFFLKQFVKGHSTDVFQTYPQLLTEMALRLPYQVHKYSEIAEPVTSVFDNAWYTHLCEYMMTSQEPFVRRQVRKLLLFICGNKDKYRQLRDVHALSTHIKAVKSCCVKGGYDHANETQHALSMTYDTLVELIEHLKACLEVAINRTGNWQKFCIHHADILPFFFQVSCLLDEGVAPTILHLLQCAIVTNVSSSGATAPAQSSSSSATISSSKKSTDSNAKTGGSGRKDREKSDDSAAEAAFEEANCGVLVEQINKQVPPEVFARFVRAFLLETNASNMRWQAHALVLAVYKNSKIHEQEQLLKLLWHLWPMLPAYGRKAAQFVDLLGYFSLVFPQKSESTNLISDYVDKAVHVLQNQNKLLAHHPNASLYMQISQFVELDGYYLESEPCLVCNNPEVPFASIKLSSLKVDSKFTTTTQIVKLLNSHTISKITLRIGDLKRTKMVRTINIYYNNRSVQAVVELKNKPALWHKAKKVVLQSGQTEVKIEFPLPIVACNLMIEYSDFYENIQASSETLQCPRCSAAVPANPGVCANCGENVFQCHKCRAINYDEKDPFLCHACGFCKYAKFDFTLVAKPCCAVEPIENDDDRKKMITSINSLLEKADRVYKQLMANKPALESLVLKITDHRSDKLEDQLVSNVTGAVNAVQSNGTQVKVNKTIQMLAQQYCNECKTSFEELSKIIQRVLVSRKELVAYDRRHMEMDSPKSQAPLLPTQTESQGMYPVSGTCSRCYGCSAAATEHCLTLLRALATNSHTEQVLCSKGLIQELVQNNLRKGTVQMQEEVRQLLCILTRDNAEATEELCNLLTERITLSLKGHTSSADLGASVRHEIELLAAMVQKEDSCWESKLRCLMRLFIKACEDSRNPLVMESVILPCLKILQSLMKTAEGGTKKTKDKINKTLTFRATSGINVDVYKWLNKDPLHSFSSWKTRTPLKSEEGPRGLPSSREEVRMHYLAEKYGRRWKRKVEKTFSTEPLGLDHSSWLKVVIFNPSSRLARQVTCNIIENMCTSPERKREVLMLLTYFLDQLSVAGESSAEFLHLYQNLIQEEPWKQFLTLVGLLEVLAHLITKEIEQLHRLEETTLTSDLAQGYSLNQLTELLASFLDDSCIRRQYKGRLVGAVLNGYLSLRRLVVQRTRLIDDTQEKLLELLEEMTTGTREETEAFMEICVETVENCKLQDVLTPVFIFERLCSIIYPEENDVGEFFLTLEKDPQQEDFLQGRMLGNPYSSLEPGLGPLMRDVKNKICQDCELVALLEDDNGMELLVNNKIMSLDLPVKDVYKKVWLAEGGEAESMRVVYRVRGLLGDATEEFVESLSNKSQSAVDNEEVYKMANILADCGGLKVMVKRLNAIQNVWRARPLLQVLLKLFRLCVKVQKVQEVLIEPQLEAAGVFLRTLEQCLENESDSSQTALTEQLLEIMETIFSKATSKSKDSFDEFARALGGPEHVRSLLSFTCHPSVRNNQPVLLHLTRVLAALVYCNEEKMRALVTYFESVFNFYRFDAEHSHDDQHKFEIFCMLTDGIERNAIGNTLRDFINSIGIVKDALNYITTNAPCVKPTLLRTDSDELKEFISKPALKYLLRFLTGLATGHEQTQMAIAAADTIPIIHRLEQVSSDEHVGSLAENLLEALRANPSVATRIEEAREFTRSEKKRLAMAMREKQLGQLGMRTNDKGQVTAKSAILQQIEELGEETGLVCCICREGYEYQPAKVLGIYTFTKRCNVEEFEAKPRKTMGYSTVTHFNIVHVDCHMSAVRLARARDEWESAALQNANTKCNGLLPLWGPQVPESAFASCLARHNAYLHESTNHRDIGHVSTIHDLKLLLLRFAFEKPFHENTGGGGPQSNMHLVPYMVHMALYVINTTRSGKKEEQTLMTYLNGDKTKVIECSWEADGPLFWLTMSVCLHSKEKWNSVKVMHLRRLLVLAQARHCSPSTPTKTLSDKSIKEYAVYKPYLVMFGLVDGIYNNFFRNVNCSVEQWPSKLADYIRYNDEALLKASERLLSTYTDELLPCSSFSEFCDVTGLLEVIADPDAYLDNLFKEF